MSNKVEFVLIENAIELQLMPAGDKLIVMHHSRVIITINKSEKEDFIKDFSKVFEKYSTKNLIKKAG